MLPFACTIFLSSFLLFLVQPLISKFILPWFGGAPSVWTTCMMFFQMMLFAGYAYADLITRKLKVNHQFVVHVLLLFVTLTLLPITPNDTWKPAAHQQPTSLILVMLTVHIGLPYFILSSTNPLLQAWFNRKFPSHSPYRLFALSNLASMLALLSYPVFFEPNFDSNKQAQVWSLGFCLFILATTWVIAKTRSSDSTRKSIAELATDSQHKKPSWKEYSIWLGLTACASILLLAITNHICQDIAVIPFLWVCPLAIYLLSFVLCFDHPRWYSRRWYILGLALCVLVLYYSLFVTALSLPSQIALFLLTLFVCCMLCHGELASLKPAPRYLTSFYLVTALGGSLGGVFVAVVAPALFSSYFELPLGVELCCSLIIISMLHKTDWKIAGRSRPVFSLVVLLAFNSVAALIFATSQNDKSLVSSSRNFFGVLRVIQDLSADSSQHKLRMYHGSTEHGFQYLADDKLLEKTAYFGEKSGVGLILSNYPKQSNRKIGIIGLGIGTLAAYGKPTDQIRYYEINPEVTKLAKKHFSYLSKSKAKISLIEGDARLSLEREESQNFDILIADAFNSDSVPVHLITVEAFELYLRHLTSNGTMIFNVTNNYLDLVPVLWKLAQHFKLKPAFFRYEGEDKLGTYPCSYVAITRDPSLFELPSISQAISPRADVKNSQTLWTDRRNNLFEILMW